VDLVVVAEEVQMLAELAYLAKAIMVALEQAIQQMVLVVAAVALAVLVQAIHLEDLLEGLGLVRL
jgi:hypothetical protein